MANCRVTSVDLSIHMHDVVTEMKCEIQATEDRSRLFARIRLGGDVTIYPPHFDTQCAEQLRAMARMLTDTAYELEEAINRRKERADASDRG